MLLVKYDILIMEVIVVPSITDWLMVGITFVYAIATIFILRANSISAKAAKEQMDEMKRQFFWENRPRISVELIYQKRSFYVLRFVNQGKQTSYHTRIIFNDEFIESLNESSFQDILRKTNEKECIIGVGQYQDIYIGSNAMRGNEKMVAVSGQIICEGIEGSIYAEDFSVDLVNYMTFFSVKSESEEIVSQLSAQTETLKEIEKSLKVISEKIERQ